MFVVFGIALIISAFILIKRFSNNSANSMLATIIMAIAPIALGGVCVVGVSNVHANAEHPSNAGSEIEVYVNTQGGAVHFGEGDKSNVQTYTNKTDKVIFVEQLGISAALGNEGVNVGQ